MIRFLSGPVVLVVMLVAGPPGGMPEPAWRTAALAVWMGIWWLTEAVPIAATALLPLVALPLLGIEAINAAAAPYANPVIFLFFGGFVLAAAFEQSGLHRRLALSLLARVGTRPDRIIAGFMIVGAFMSMWVSNTAAVLMMLPLAKSFFPSASGDTAAQPARSFEKALLLGIAYSATIGGFGTLIGTPPNALLAGFLSQTYGIRVGFVDYMKIGVPIVVIALPITWLLLTRVAFRVQESTEVVASQGLAAQRAALGPASRAEWFVGSVAVLTALAWITQPLTVRLVPSLSETSISVACAVVLLVVPISGKWNRVISWEDAERIPWGVLVLFGGGLSLAAAIQSAGLAQWIGDSVGVLRAVPPLVMVLGVVTMITFLGEFTSNTATAAAFMPVAASLAVGAGMNPLVLAVAAGLAASNGFMMPVGTPPNAIVFAGKRLSIPEMARAGVLVDLMFILLITFVAYAIALPVLG